MTQKDNDIRPDCSEILDQIHSWTLNSKDIMREKEFDQVKQQAKKIENVKERIIFDILEKKLENPRPVNKFQNEALNKKAFPQSGRFVEKFGQIRIISTGFTSTVYRAMNRTDSNSYAIKRIKIFNDDDYRESIFSEWKIISKLRSDYIIKYFSIWLEEIEKKNINNMNKSKDNTIVNFNRKEEIWLYIQMELCYKTLEEVLKQMETEMKEWHKMVSISYFVLSQLLKEILESVDYLHKQNPPFIHEKLNTKNILITYGMNGRFIKLSNLFSKTTEKFDEQMNRNKYESKSKYIAPEYLFGEYDTKADIYSLGVIIMDLFSSYIKV
jgi:serine/threonine protein kinase